MSQVFTPPRQSPISKQQVLRVILLLLSGSLAWIALVLPIIIRPSSFLISVGDVVPQDIQAPRDISYPSAELTEIARREAENSVPPVYLPADPSITRRQIEDLRIALTFIDTVHSDIYASKAQKLADLQTLKDLQLNSGTAESLLNMDQDRWQLVQKEAISVFEQVMRRTIQENRVEETRRSIPSLVSFSIQPEQASIVTDLVTPFVVPNSLFSEEQTDIARESARTSIKPVVRTFAAGETIVSRGQVLTAPAWEALEQFNLVEPQNYNEDMIGSALLVILVGVFVGLYLYHRRGAQVNNLRSLALIALLFLIFLLGARTIIPNRTILPYIYPIPAFGLTLAVLFNMEIGIIFSLILSVMATYGLAFSPDLTIFYIFSSLCSIFILGKARRVISFFWAGVAIALAGSAVVIAYRLPDMVTDGLGILTLAGAAMFNGLASASLTLLFQFLFAHLLGFTTALQLLELSRPDHPLLQYMLRNAPGTYQHSLQVANLAEQAAEAIGADALLTRVGAIFHDCGKAQNPLYFIENQVPGFGNPHDTLDPALSAATIIQHVTDGLSLARKHHLPSRIQDFISQHHGTLITRFQYTKAVDAEGGDPSRVDMELYRYPGPRPNSLETALLMLADGVEARARAELPKDTDGLRDVIKKVFIHCQREGQLDDTRLTFHDLNVAAESFLKTLRGLHHPRIKYPELKQTNSQESDTTTNSLPSPANPS